jgi:hypothetical protein
MSERPLTFPTLTGLDAEPSAADWPAPPFARWRNPLTLDLARPCILQTASGDDLTGEFLAFDPGAGTLRFRARADGPEVTLPFSRFARLTLAHPQALSDPETGLPLASLPVAAHQRAVTLTRRPPLPPLEGITIGHVERDEGLYLFEPVDGSGVMVRAVFVPRAAFVHRRLGPSALDWAAEHWITEPEALLQAIARQQRMAVLPMGQALKQLGMATQEQIDDALAQPMGDMPLGERLVALRVISAGDLQTALAHKMGYPVVDLTRFPIDPHAVRALPVRTAIACRCVPLMIDGRRLIVAVDRPSRLDRLRERHVLVDLVPVATVASRAHLKAAFGELVQQDVWVGSVAVKSGFFLSTR